MLWAAQACQIGLSWTEYLPPLRRIRSSKYVLQTEHNHYYWIREVHWWRCRGDRMILHSKCAIGYRHVEEHTSMWWQSSKKWSSWPRSLSGDDEAEKEKSAPKILFHMLCMKYPLGAAVTDFTGCWQESATGSIGGSWRRFGPFWGWERSRFSFERKWSN